MSARTTATAVALLAATSAMTALLAPTLSGPRQMHATLTPQIVPVELVLLVDTSGSVDSREYDLQKQGYSKAFRHEDIHRLIESVGSVAVTYIEWSSVDHQNTRIGWTLLEDELDCRDFARKIDRIERTDEGWTKLAPALKYAVESLESNDYIGMKQVIDVSGDGVCQNYEFYELGNLYDPAEGDPWDEVLLEVNSVVDCVNGVCITTDIEVIDFYREVLPQGADSFMLQTDTFDGFGDVILQKLMREIEVVPGLYD